MLGMAIVESPIGFFMDSDSVLGLVGMATPEEGDEFDAAGIQRRAMKRLSDSVVKRLMESGVGVRPKNFGKNLDEDSDDVRWRMIQFGSLSRDGDDADVVFLPVDEGPWPVFLIQAEPYEQSPGANVDAPVIRIADSVLDYLELATRLGGIGDAGGLRDLLIETTDPDGTRHHELNPEWGEIKLWRQWFLGLPE